MNAIKKVMVCVDLSDYSRKTVEYAVDMATAFQSELIFFTVLHKRDTDAVRTASHYYPEIINVDRYLDKARTDRLERIEDLIGKTVPAGSIATRIIIENGIPFEEILKWIELENIDLVILGNKGRSNIRGTLLGSNAEKVFRHSPVPVLSIRSRENFGRDK